MKHPIAFSIWVLLAALSFAYAYSGRLTYDLGDTMLTVRVSEFCGWKVAETRIPVKDISKFDIKVSGFGRSRSSCRLLIVGNDGQCLRSDELGRDASKFHIGLQQALLKRPVGTFHDEHTTTLPIGWFMVAGCILVAFHEGFAIKGK